MGARSVTPMFADTSRNMAVPEPMLSAPPNPVGLPNHDMERIKAEVYRDLLLRMKDEYARGG
jgi:hypothetical protein